MAISRVQHGTMAETATAGGSPTISNVTGGNLLVCICIGYSNGASWSFAATASDNQGNTLTRHTAAANDGDPGGFPVSCAVYSIVLPASYVTYTVTVTMTSAGATSGADLILAEYSGAAASGQFDQTAHNSSTLAQTSQNTGTTAANGATTSLACAGMALVSGVAASGIAQAGGANWPTADTTPDTNGGTIGIEQDNTTFQPGILCDSITTAWHSATATDSFTSTTGGHWYAAIATFSEFVATGPPPPRTLGAMIPREQRYQLVRV